MRRPAVLYGSLALAAIGFVVACGGDPSPVKPSELSPSPFADIQVIGPGSIGPGQRVQFVANIRQADGTTKSATSMPNLRWASSNTSVVNVSSSGVVTARDSLFGVSEYGEAVITAEFTNQTGVRGTREVVVRNPVTGTLDVSQSGTEPGQVFYAFAVKLTESAGVPRTVTDLWTTFDDGWGGQCFWTPDKLGQTLLPANGTLALGPVTCDDFHEKAFNVVVSIILTDDDGNLTYVDLYRTL